MRILALALLLTACQSAPLPPPQPTVLRETLPTSPTTLLDAAAYGDALSGYLRGTTASLKGNEPQAAKGFLATLAEDPDNLALRTRVFDLSLLEGDVPTAIRLARTLPPRQGDVIPILARVTGGITDGKLAQAQTDIQTVTTQIPDLIQFRLLESYLSLAQGTPVEKEIATLEALKGPQQIEARKLYHLARMWQRAGQHAKAQAALERSNTLEPAALFTTLMLADIYQTQGRTSDAQNLLNTFRDKNPAVALLDADALAYAEGSALTGGGTTTAQDAALTMFDFGLLIWSQGAVGPARQVMNLALHLDPTNPYLLYYAGIVDESGQAHASAREKYARIPADSPVGLAAQIRHAEATFRAGDTAEGLAMAQALARQHPHLIGVQSSLAEMAFDTRDYRTALTAYDNLLNLQRGKPTPPQVLAAMYFARGASYERMGRHAQASQDLSMSLILNPANPSVLNYLAYMWVERGENVTEATIMLERALEAAPDDGAIMDSLGWAYYQQGNYEKALTLLEAAADATPDDATVFLHLGDVHAKLGNMVSAQRYWRQAKIHLKPEDDATLHRTVRDRLK